jgi:hypothetical protein
MMCNPVASAMRRALVDLVRCKRGAIDETGDTARLELLQIRQHLADNFIDAPAVASGLVRTDEVAHDMLVRQSEAQLVRRNRAEDCLYFVMPCRSAR